MAWKTKAFHYFGFILASLFLLVGTAPAADAAKLFLTSPSNQYYYGDTVVMAVRLDPEGECVNAVSAEINFSVELLKAVDFNRAKSILSLWIGQPKIDQTNGKISFVGGVPGGYCGRLAGDTDASNVLGEIIFRLPGTVIGGTASNEAQINLSSSSRVLLNDGKGTAAKLTLTSQSIKIDNRPTAPVPAGKPTAPGEPAVTAPVTTPSEDLWRETLQADKQPPENLIVGLYRSQAIFNNQYFIVFSAVDKQTGIDYYEVQEGGGVWQKAASPYQLTDQTLSGVIRVKAWDKAGNYKIVEYYPPQVQAKAGGLFYFPWIFIIALVVILILTLGVWYGLFRLLNRKKNRD